MTTFTLTICIDSSDLVTITDAGESVVLVRSFRTIDPGNVAWWVFSPFGTNTVTWEDGGYGTFASETAIQVGELIQIVGTGGAAEGESVTFTENKTFSGPSADPNVQSGQYGVINRYSDLSVLTFGLQQALSVNSVTESASPLVASQIPRGQFMVFQPSHEVSVFLDSSILTGQVLQVPVPPSTTLVTSFATTVNLSPDSPSATLHYNSSKGQFEQVADNPC
jgi:hypothetical protein